MTERNETNELTNETTNNLISLNNQNVDANNQTIIKQSNDVQPANNASSTSPGVDVQQSTVTSTNQPTVRNEIVVATHDDIPSIIIPSHPSPSTTSNITAPKPYRAVAVDDCCVCFNGESEEDNPILFCDGPGCKCVVHQFCYGVDDIPEGDWLCDMCTIKADHSKASSLSLLQFDSCLLCPSTEGAFKPTVDGRWVHAACAIWTPETGFRDAETLDVVIGIDSIERNRWRLVCDICHKKQGTCVQCMGPQCRYSFHVPCGWQAGLRMELLPIGRGDAMEVVKLVYCDRHQNETFNPKQKSRSTIRLNVAVAESEPSTPHSPSKYKCSHCGARSIGHECPGQRRASNNNDHISDDDDDEIDEDLRTVQEQFFKQETDAEKSARQKRWVVERDIMEEAQAIVQVEQFGRAIEDRLTETDEDVLTDGTRGSDSDKPKKKRKRKSESAPLAPGEVKRGRGRPPKKRLSEPETEADILKRKEEQRKRRQELNNQKAEQRMIDSLKAHSTQGKLMAAQQQRNQEIVTNPSMYAAPLVVASQAAIQRPSTIPVLGPQNRGPILPRADVLAHSNDPNELEKRVMLCISSEVPMVRKEMIKSLIVDCEDQQRLENIARIFIQYDNGYGLFKLCEWVHEGLANSIFPYVTIIIQSLAKLVRKEWNTMPVLISSLISIIQRSANCLSPLVKSAVKTLQSRLVQIGAIQQSVVTSMASSINALMYPSQQPSPARRSNGSSSSQPSTPILHGQQNKPVRNMPQNGYPSQQPILGSVASMPNQPFYDSHQRQHNSQYQSPNSFQHNASDRYPPNSFHLQQEFHPSYDPQQSHHHQQHHHQSINQTNSHAINQPQQYQQHHHQPINQSNNHAINQSQPNSMRNDSYFQNGNYDPNGFASGQPNGGDQHHHAQSTNMHSSNEVLSQLNQLQSIINQSQKKPPPHQQHPVHQQHRQAQFQQSSPQQQQQYPQIPQQQRYPQQQSDAPLPSIGQLLQSLQSAANTAKHAQQRM